MGVAFLSEHPPWVDMLAAWHHAEWGHLYDDWTLASARAELATHARGGAFPTTLVWHDDGDLRGSVSLVEEDAPALRERGGPWLASLFVTPAARGRGLGAALVRAAVAQAARTGQARLCLFTPEHADFYRRLGWRSYDRAVLRGTPVELMAIDPSAAGAA